MVNDVGDPKSERLHRNFVPEEDVRAVEDFFRRKKNEIWLLLRHQASRKKLYFLQDGATCHTTQMNLGYLKSKFGNRVISNKTEIPWPPNSPDLNPLDFFFWGHSMNHVFRSQPATIEDLKSVVNYFARNMSKEMIHKACKSAYVRFEKLREMKGGHFEHLL